MLPGKIATKNAATTHPTATRCFGQRDERPAECQLDQSGGDDDCVRVDRDPRRHLRGELLPGEGEVARPANSSLAPRAIRPTVRAGDGGRHGVRVSRAGRQRTTRNVRCVASSVATSRPDQLGGAVAVDVQQALAPVQQDRHEVQRDLVDQPRGQRLTGHVGAAHDEHLPVARGRPAWATALATPSVTNVNVALVIGRGPARGA